jgi:glutamate---cysteine ligase / carboxylate-amine ligase
VAQPIAAFGAYGIELEYMIVESDSLDVAPLAETFLDAMPRRADCCGVAIGWSNEIVTHVAELKNVDPVQDLACLPLAFQESVRAANRVLAGSTARLLPTGMHPWMDPGRESVLWTRSDADIYTAYDRIFDCRRHGWANVQSMHVNLPFADDAQFARLLSAIRLVLPMVPALAASSPYVDGGVAGERDHRLAVYTTHAARVPEMLGAIVPEPSTTRAGYERDILLPMYDAIASLDPDGVLRHEWLNCRGAIARFDRNAIEIRLADTQECPRADIAVAHAICALVKMLYDAHDTGDVPTGTLAALLQCVVRDGEDAIAGEDYLHALGVHGAGACSMRDAWRRALDCADADASWRDTVDVILERGTLATRILQAAGPRPSRPRLREVYGELAGCLDEDRLFA